MSNLNEKDSLEQGPAEKWNVVKEALQKLEDNFAVVGELLSSIKRSKIWAGQFKSFREYLQHDLHMNVPMANRFIRFYELYQVELDIDQEVLKQIGYDRLSIITPAMVEADYEQQQELLEKAKSMNNDDLLDEVKKIRAKEKSLSPRDVFASQFVEEFTTCFNCSAKELNFIMALYFYTIKFPSHIQDQDTLDLRDEIKQLNKLLPDMLKEEKIDTEKIIRMAKDLNHKDLPNDMDAFRQIVKVARAKWEHEVQQTLESKPEDAGSSQE